MRASVVGSGCVHLAVLIVLLVAPRARTIVVPGPEVVQVALVDPAPIPPVSPPIPPPEEPVKAPEIKPTEEAGVKVTPPKRVHKPVEKPSEPAPAPAATELPSAPAGNAGLRGDLVVDSADFEFTYYLLLIRDRVAQNWSPPAGLVTAGKPVRVIVYFKIGRAGEVTDARIETGSSIEFFDRSALRAVTISEPLPPLPLGFSGSDLGVHFGFEYSGP